MLAVVSRFLQVGAVAFVVDAGVLWILVYIFNWPPIAARVVSFSSTIALTFVLNARYTFAVPMSGASKTRYVIIQCLGAGLNFGLYSSLILLAWLGPLWSLVVGSAAASTHNFLLMRRYVYAQTNDTPHSSHPPTR